MKSFKEEVKEIAQFVCNKIIASSISEVLSSEKIMKRIEKDKADSTRNKDITKILIKEIVWKHIVAQPFAKNEVEIEFAVRNNDNNMIDEVYSQL